MNLKQENLADEVVQGDQEIGKWQIVKTINPDVICLGYDQENLKNALIKALENKDLSFKIEIIEPFKGDILHSSILNNKGEQDSES
jgi:glycerol-3-phosphate cytidylyltransferase-like family protein